MNLRHFIVSNSDIVEKPDSYEEDEISPAEENIAVATTSTSLPSTSSVDKTIKMFDYDGKTRELAVLPITAVFHKFAGGKGTPHSFVGFLRQYPALPRVVVCSLIFFSRNLGYLRKVYRFFSQLGYFP